MFVTVGAGTGLTYLGGTLGNAIPGVGTILGSIGGLLAGSLLGGFTGTYFAYKINNLWRIIDPVEVFNVLNTNINEDGSFRNIKDIFESIKLDYVYSMNNIPEILLKESKINGNLNAHVIWPCFIFANVITFVAAFKGELQEECGRMFEKSIKFLRHEDNKNNIDKDDQDIINYQSLKYYKYLEELKDILENWVNLLTS